ncbi:helix-turn-helix transcriptional regulator [Chromobacterium sp. ATCC 53434]|uniref:helix-turn-helix transcriptional regulator n=1 Tax=Chromobacterium sp. (strain ATCC 53434 / SC 14030) TaxID=2059672 RepID=UPI0013053E57|nr:helix-turn-helix transcriptional regulator [Chromobacterium sp. ATCC 53434]
MNTVREARQLLKLSQKQLAGKCGCSQGRIAQLENGNGKASPELARRIAAALDIPVLNVLYPSK